MPQARQDRFLIRKEVGGVGKIYFSLLLHSFLHLLHISGLTIAHVPAG